MSRFNRRPTEEWNSTAGRAVLAEGVFWLILAAILMAVGVVGDWLRTNFKIVRVQDVQHVQEAQE